MNAEQMKRIDDTKLDSTQKLQLTSTSHDGYDEMYNVTRYLCAICNMTFTIASTNMNMNVFNIHVLHTPTHFHNQDPHPANTRGKTLATKQCVKTHQETSNTISL